jgi:uroporphyrinogen-III decarboxylase
MTSRERVWRAINHQVPDRVPIDLGGTRASGISAATYDRLKRRLGLKSPTKILDSMQLLAEVEPEMLQALHVDVVPLEGALAAWNEMPCLAGIERQLPSGITAYFAPGTNIRTESDGSWVLLNAGGEAFARMPKDGFYFDFIRPTMASRRIDPARYRPLDTVSDEELEAFARRARFLHENTDKVVLGWGASISLVGLSALLSDNITQGSLDEWLCLLVAEKPTAHEMMARCVDAAIARLKLYHQAAGDRVMVWGAASDDAGTQRAGLLSPDLFVEMILPHYRRFCGWIHDHTPYRTFVHSCGAVADYIAGWIEAGVDIINPVQISAAGMEPQRLMRQFGGRIVFWGGGCETQKVLPLGTPDQVRRHVRQNVETFTADLTSGGFVFTQVHNVQPNVPAENVQAMLEAACEFGRF